MFRIAQFCKTRFGKLAAPISFIYRQYALSYIGLDLPVSTEVGRCLRIHHGIGLVINGSCKIGTGVELRQNTTIGSRIGPSDAPTLRDNVSVGANCVVMGRIDVGENVTVGAGCVLLSSVDPGSTVVGNPSRVIRANELGSECYK
ncbi:MULTISPECIES: serine acetyltransferase [unclassified Rhodococcus (in: high G+C Gram-positive bacteria)]|uniref:serine acetyltransferase n=1 Tax=unclassified Rhodococcus (in: high G+C Gram-positive bacteria) TaxID=192944 RepID=UPI0034E84513